LNSRPLSDASVHLFENHDQSLYVWRDAGVRERVLVHVDAHHDMDWIAPDQPITIGNYICQALREEQLRELVWVVPDASFASASAREELRRELRTLARRYPERADVVSADTGLSITLLGRPLRVCALADLPQFAEPVLLDVDIDYFLLPTAMAPQTEAPPLPWIWPEELMGALVRKGLSFDIATIAYSVEGGYTPLRWKYLGDELKERLQGKRLNFAEQLQEAAILLERRENSQAEAAVREAVRMASGSGAADYHAALLCQSQGKLAEAREHMRRTLELDPGYATAYNTLGPVYWQRRQWDYAEREYRRAIDLDPRDAYAHFGMAQSFARRKQWSDAEAELTQCLATDPELPDVWRLRGRVFTEQKRHAEAISAYNKFLLLTLKGKRTILSPQMTGGAELLDVGHAAVHAELGRIYQKIGEHRQAVQAFRISIAAHRDRASTRLRMARSLLAQRKWKEAGAQLLRAVVLIPGDVRRSARRWIGQSNANR
jgi:tetratricopeptide (TPR) repeat protein